MRDETASNRAYGTAVAVGRAVWADQWRVRPILLLTMTASIAFFVYTPTIIASSSDISVAVRRVLLSGVAPVSIVAGVLVATTVGRLFDLSRWTHVLVARPDRPFVAAGYVGALSLWAATVASLPLLGATVFISMSVSATFDVGTLIPVLASVGIGFVQMAMFAILGGAIGLLARSAASAGLIAVGWMAILEPAVGRLLPRLGGSWLPGQAIFSLGAPEPSSRVFIAAILWVVSMAAAAALRFDQVDVT